MKPITRETTDEMFERYTKDDFVMDKARFWQAVNQLRIESNRVETVVIPKIAELQREINRLNKAIEEIKGTAGACSDAEVGEYGLYEYCQKIQNESNFSE